MNRALIEAIIHGANLATADAFPGHKHALKENALNVFKLMMDDAKQYPPEGIVTGAVCECGRIKFPDTLYCDQCQDDHNARQDAYDRMNLARGL